MYVADIINSVVSLSFEMLSELVYECLFHIQGRGTHVS